MSGIAEFRVVGKIDYERNATENYNLAELGNRIYNLVKETDRTILEKYTFGHYANHCMREEIRFIRKGMKALALPTDYLLNLLKEFDESIHDEVSKLSFVESKFTIVSDLLEYLNLRAKETFEKHQFNKYLKFREAINLINDLVKSYNIDRQIIIKKLQNDIKTNNRHIREIENSFDEQIEYKSGKVYINSRDELLYDSISEFLSEVSQYIAKEKYSSSRITKYITELSVMLQSNEIPAEFKPRISQLISKLAMCLTEINSTKDKKDE